MMILDDRTTLMWKGTQIDSHMKCHLNILIVIIGSHLKCHLSHVNILLVKFKKINLIKLELKYIEQLSF